MFFLLTRMLVVNLVIQKVAPDEPSEGKVVQRRGRFQVTSDNIAQKVTSSARKSSRTNLPIGVTRPTFNLSAILPTLQFLMQQNTMQKEVLSRLISSIEETSDASDAIITDSSQSSGSPSARRNCSHTSSICSKVLQNLLRKCRD